MTIHIDINQSLWNTRANGPCSRLSPLYTHGKPVTLHRTKTTLKFESRLVAAEGCQHRKYGKPNNSVETRWSSKLFSNENAPIINHVWISNDNINKAWIKFVKQTILVHQCDSSQKKAISNQGKIKSSMPKEYHSTHRSATAVIAFSPKAEVDYKRCFRLIKKAFVGTDNSQTSLGTIVPV